MEAELSSITDRKNEPDSVAGGVDIQFIGERINTGTFRENDGRYGINWICKLQVASRVGLAIVVAMF